MLEKRADDSRLQPFSCAAPVRLIADGCEPANIGGKLTIGSGVEGLTGYILFYPPRVHVSECPGRQEKSRPEGGRVSGGGPGVL
jgi:hypothetical protein